MTHDLTHRVLTAVAAADAHDTVWWRCDGPFAPVTFFAQCSDTFDWASADCEQITEENVAEFERAMADVLAATGGDGTYGSALFAARLRGRRPQGAAYPSDKRLWPLFDACGPERELTLMNPLAQPGLAGGLLAREAAASVALDGETVLVDDGRDARCGDYPAPCNCDDPVSHDGAAAQA